MQTGDDLRAAGDIEPLKGAGDEPLDDTHAAHARDPGHRASPDARDRRQQHARTPRAASPRRLGRRAGRGGRRHVGFDGHGSDSTRPKVEAFFTSESYPRGGSAHLVIADHAKDVSVRIFHAGAESAWTTANDQMFGRP